MGSPMSIDLNSLVEHDLSGECPVCRTQDIVNIALLPAAAAWELNNGLPRFALALHGAAGLLAAMLEEGVPRTEIETAMSTLLDDIESQIDEDSTMGGPPQGTA